MLAQNVWPALQAYFVRSVDKDGYGLKHNHPLIFLIDAHTSRWSYKGLWTLIEADIYPFFIASHSSAWAQPNDDGLNGLYKAMYGRAVQAWRAANPYMVFDRQQYNWCCAYAIVQVFQVCIYTHTHSLHVTHSLHATHSFCTHTFIDTTSHRFN